MGRIGPGDGSPASLGWSPNGPEEPQAEAGPQRRGMRTCPPSSTGQTDVVADVIARSVLVVILFITESLSFLNSKSFLWQRGEISAQ